MLGTLALSSTVNTEKASAAGCDDLAGQIIEAARQLGDANRELASAALWQQIYAGNLAVLETTAVADPVATNTDEFRERVNSAQTSLRRTSAEFEQARTNVAQQERTANRLRQQWSDDDCDDPPPPSSAICRDRLPSLDALIAAIRGRVRGGTPGRRAIEETAASLLPPIGDRGFYAIGRLGPDGVLVNPVNGQRIQSPYSTPADPDYIQFRLGMGSAAIGQVYTVNVVQIQVRNTDGPLTMMNLVGSDGRPVVSENSVPAVPGADAAWSSWARTQFYLQPGPGPITVALPIGTAAAVALAPLLRQAAIWLGRSILTLGGVTLLRLISQLTPDPNCGFHVELAYSTTHGSSPAGSSASVGASSINLADSKLRAFDFQPPPADTTPPTNTDPPDTGAGEGGDGLVAFSGSTCGRINGTWDWRVFVGSKQDHIGFSLRYKGNLGTSWRGPNPGAKVFVHLSDGHDTDPTSLEAKAIWQRYAAQVKQQTQAVIAGSRGRLVDPDGFGRGRHTKLELKGPLASGMARMTVKPGCNVSTPPNYQEHDTPEY